MRNRDEVIRPTGKRSAATDALLAAIESTIKQYEVSPVSPGGHTR